MPVMSKMLLTYIIFFTATVSAQPFVESNLNAASHKTKPPQQLASLVSTSSSQPLARKFSEIPAGAERKQAFVRYFLLIIQQENSRLLRLRQQLSVLHDQNNRNEIELNWLHDLAALYQYSSFDADNEADWQALLAQVDIVSPSLALAQSANESAWGSSRFAEQGNNFFGQWCFNQGCGMVPIYRSAGASHEVAAYDTPSASVQSYIHNLNSNRAFAPFRKIRADLRAQNSPLSGHQLAMGLELYSARGKSYITALQKMIQQNNWQQLDATSAI